MLNFSFYTFTILIWGSTWLAIKYQLGVIDPAWSITYRFAMAALMLMFWCLITRRPMRFSTNDHLFMALQGILLFALNYYLFYLSELHITSGLAAVVFSTIVVMNLINGRLFLGSPIELRVLLGGGAGLMVCLCFFGLKWSLSISADRSFMGCFSALPPPIWPPSAIFSQLGTSNTVFLLFRPMPME